VFSTVTEPKKRTAIASDIAFLFMIRMF